MHRADLDLKIKKAQIVGAYALRSDLSGVDFFMPLTASLRLGVFASAGSSKIHIKPDYMIVNLIFFNDWQILPR